ncbi:hypothetical protein CDAR_33041 [Caerostris darwini]|uniref:Uncharacterized protein n=1 Tax=Caerostris darwini TaxID=1538125 RepID=A0AAV4SMZ6_9ARAC|nr:hypothetical protein CDAR_33041 [Caerostris darwini]
MDTRVEKPSFTPKLILVKSVLHCNAQQLRAFHFFVSWQNRYRRALFSYTTSTDPPFTLENRGRTVFTSNGQLEGFFPFFLSLHTLPSFHLASKTALLIENPSRWGCRKVKKAFRQEIFKRQEDDNAPTP